MLIKVLFFLNQVRISVSGADAVKVISAMIKLQAMIYRKLKFSANWTNIIDSIIDLMSDEASDLIVHGSATVDGKTSM